MYRIIEKTNLNPTIGMMRIEAPLIARKAKPGQFIILRVNEDGERTPFTIAKTDIEEGSVTIIFQIVGKTTQDMDKLKTGDYLQDFVGPLGNPSCLDGYEGKNVCVIGGGLGNAIAYPQAKCLHEKGAIVDIIAGFRNKDIIILEDEMREVSDNFYVITDDGSNGKKGFVTDVLQEQLDKGKRYELVVAVGPLIMMKSVCEMTRPYEIHTVVSMNSIMIDGTGMCGGCRLTYDGKTKFACVDGPEFDGHKVDFDEAIMRSKQFKKAEQQSIEYACKLTGEVHRG
ncbi:MAG: sulfide/dihydroorotate dehydrogenase-like FAD/NAD-binding protein [Erysipelotrichaceae bacterium]|jgi:ferredoxin--NADP+ reductase|nr:sulfide/dihydroorotate dehydrogenase-like FAD/NAD-binding protein [Erysipelotrichaceae bacterium]